MNNKKVLIVDDEQYVREFVAQIISNKYQCLFAGNGEEAIKTSIKEKPDLILLDMLMPGGMNGIQISQELRSAATTKHIPIIMLTAVNDTEQRTNAYLAGVDDYLSKPFTPNELLARIDSKLRRLAEHISNATKVSQFGDLTLDYENLRLVTSTGTILELGQVEFKILNCLIKYSGKLVDRDLIHSYVWGDEVPSERALDPHINSLRKKLRASKSELKTVYGKGFSLLFKESILA